MSVVADESLLNNFNKYHIFLTPCWVNFGVNKVESYLPGSQSQNWDVCSIVECDWRNHVSSSAVEAVDDKEVAASASVAVEEWSPVPEREGVKWLV